MLLMLALIEWGFPFPCGNILAGWLRADIGIVGGLGG